MKVLIACEFSGIIREAFARRGHEAWSADLLDTEIPSSFHYKGDVREILGEGFSLMIAHPPCQHLAVSGARWFEEKRKDGRQQAALSFVQELMNAPIDKICIENPVSIISTHIRKASQWIQPYQFGHGESKRTGLWLKKRYGGWLRQRIVGRIDHVHIQALLRQWQPSGVEGGHYEY